MKTIKTILFGLFVLVLTFGCDKDEDPVKDEEKTNSFIYQSLTHNLNSGHLDTWSSEDTDEYSVFSIYLVSSDIQVGVSGQSGTGDAMYFEMLSSSLTELSEGEYIFDETKSEFPMYCFESTMYIGYDFDSGIGTHIDVISGKINISKIEEVYEITFDLKLENENNVSGYFKGNLN